MKISKSLFFLTSHFLRAPVPPPPPNQEHLTKFSKFKSSFTVLFVCLLFLNNSLGPNLGFELLFRQNLNPNFKKGLPFSSCLLFQPIFLIPATKIMEVSCCLNRSLETLLLNQSVKTRRMFWSRTSSDNKIIFRCRVFIVSLFAKCSYTANNSWQFKKNLDTQSKLVSTWKTKNKKPQQ